MLCKCVHSIDSCLFSGGRSRYNDGPYNCNGGDGGKQIIKCLRDSCLACG